MASEILKNILDTTPDYLGRFSDKSFDVVDQIDYILAKKGWNRADLAKKMQKDQAEVSKWMGRTHNLTLKSIARIEAALGESILQTPLRHRASQINAKGPAENEVRIYNNLRNGAQFVGATVSHTVAESSIRPPSRTLSRRKGTVSYSSRPGEIVASVAKPANT